MNFQPIDVRRELWQGIELCLRLAPIVAGPPVPNQLLQLRQLRTLRLIGDGFLIGPSGRRDPMAKVDERLLRNIRPKRTDCVFVKARPDTPLCSMAARGDQTKTESKCGN